MNLSGDAVSEIVSQYQIRHHNIIIVHDDIDLDFGKIKIKAGGGSAGHRGIESIICFLRDDAFTRVRIGVGRPPSGIDGAEFVLQTFTGEEKNQVQDVICRAEKCIEMILTQGTEAAMTVFHRKKVAMAD